MKISPCPVKERASALGLKVLSPEKITDIENEIKAAGADYGAAVAYGQLIKEHIINIPKLGIINIHFSLLPFFRGAAPVQHSLFAGVKETGVTAFWIDRGCDTGPVFLKRALPVSPDDDCKTLFAKLIPLGTKILEEVIENIRTGQIIKQPQTVKITSGVSEETMYPLNVEVEEFPKPSSAPVIKKEDTVLDFNNMSAAAIHNRVRGLACGPNARALIETPSGKDTVQIINTSLCAAPPAAGAFRAGAAAGVDKDGRILVKCMDGFLYINTLRPAGKNDMRATDFLNGRGLKPEQIIFY
jgi:methionyl-tRNA formyltransferase